MATLNKIDDSSISVINWALRDAQTVFTIKKNIIEIVDILKRISESAQMVQLFELLT